jgi:ADP-ribose pyrophosphatase
MLSRPGRARRRRLLPYVPAVVEERGAWRTFSERTIYDNRRVRLGLVDVESPDGRRWDYHVVHLARIAVELIVNESTDEVLMLWRYRFATDQWGYELLGGLADEGEESAATAAREAANEPGWAPLGPAEKLINFESLPGNVTAPMDVSYGGPSSVGEPTDAEEVGRIEWGPFSRVTELFRPFSKLRSSDRDRLSGLMKHVDPQPNCRENPDGPDDRLL